MDAGKQLKLNNFNWANKPKPTQPKAEGNPNSEVVVAIIGDGVDISHPALQGKVLNDESEFSGSPSGPNGTHAAGVISGTPMPATNYGADTVNIMPVRIFDGTEKHVPMPGTGYAAPTVTGMASLLRAENPGMTNDEVKAALQAKASELGWKTSDR